MMVCALIEAINVAYVESRPRLMPSSSPLAHVVGDSLVIRVLACASVNS